MNPYLKALGALAAVFVGASVAITAAQGSVPVPLLLIGLVLGVLWLVVKAVRHRDDGENGTTGAGD